MAQNSAGYVPITDGGNPRTVSGYAKEAVSGGQFLFGSGAANVVSSGTNSFDTTDIEFAAGASGAQFNGLCLNSTAASGALIAIATRGLFIVAADGTVVAGQKVMTQGAHAVAPLGSVAGNVAALLPIGRAVTSAGSEGHCIVDIQG